MSTVQAPIVLTDSQKLPRGTKRIEAFDRACRELFFVTHPQFKKGQPEANKAQKKFLKKSRVPAVWIYYPESQTAIRTVAEEYFFQLRTARNRQLITAEEQKKYRQCRVGVAGLSVGSGILSALVISGGPKIVKIADFDEIEITNLNRLRAGLADVGKNKAAVAAREIWRVDPFARIFLWEKGLNSKNIKNFLLGQPRLDIFVDEMDDLVLKIKSRLICRARRLPVVMATDNGEGAIIDVERFDQEPRRPLFHGLVGKFGLRALRALREPSDDRWLELATKIVGPDFLTDRMRTSLLAIGREIAAVPQLGTAAAVAGAAVALVVRRIANSQLMPSGRYLITLEEKLISGYNSCQASRRRHTLTKKLQKRLAAH